MSRHQPETGSGPEVGPGAGPCENSINGYKSIPLGDTAVENAHESRQERRSITLSVGATDFYCEEIKREDVLEGAMDVVLVNCNDDYYVLLIRNTYNEPLDVYDFHRRWTWERAEFAVREFAKEECVCCDSDDYYACIIDSVNYAVHTILRFQAEADKLQWRQYAKERKAYKEAALEGELDF